MLTGMLGKQNRGKKDRKISRSKFRSPEKSPEGPPPAGRRRPETETAGHPSCTTSTPETQTTANRTGKERRRPKKP